jgi:hypothetical protein
VDTEGTQRGTTGDAVPNHVNCVTALLPGTDLPVWADILDPFHFL